jgi:hypothetical protein
MMAMVTWTGWHLSGIEQFEVIDTRTEPRGREKVPIADVPNTAFGKEVVVRLYAILLFFFFKLVYFAICSNTFNRILW